MITNAEYRPAAVWLPPLAVMALLLLLGLGMSSGLYFLVPGTHWYVGMSGAIHGLFVLGLGRQVVASRDLIAGGCLAYLVGKIAWEMIAGVPVSDEAAIGGSVLVESHLYGSLSGLIYGLMFGAFFRAETFGRPKSTAEEPQ